MSKVQGKSYFGARLCNHLENLGLSVWIQYFKIICNLHTLIIKWIKAWRKNLISMKRYYGVLVTLTFCLCKIMHYWVKSFLHEHSITATVLKHHLIFERRSKLEWMIEHKSILALSAVWKKKTSAPQWFDNFFDFLSRKNANIVPKIWKYLWNLRIPHSYLFIKMFPIS